MSKIYWVSGGDKRKQEWSMGSRPRVKCAVVNEVIREDYV